MSSHEVEETQASDPHGKKDTAKQQEEAPGAIGIYERPKNPLLAHPKLLIALIIFFLIMTAVVFAWYVIL